MAKRLRLPNGFGSITKRKEKLRNKWLARTAAKLTESGYKRKTLGFFKTYDEAYNALLEYNNCPINLDDNNHYNFKFLINKFISEKENNISEKTLNRYKNAIDNFKEFYDYKIKDLTYQPLQNILNDLPMSTGKSALVVINYIYDESIKLELISKNIAPLLKASKIKTKIVVRKAYSVKEINKIYELSNNTDNVYADVLITLFYTGARISEILEIKLQNIFLNDRYFIGGKKTESGTDRIIPIHKKLIPIFKKQLKLCKENNLEYLFAANNQNITSDNYKYYFYKIIKLLDIENNIHSVRHTFISKMKSLEVNDSKLKRIIGHKTNDITDSIYTHYSADDLIKLIDKFEY